MLVSLFCFFVFFTYKPLTLKDDDVHVVVMSCGFFTSRIHHHMGVALYVPGSSNVKIQRISEGSSKIPVLYCFLVYKYGLKCMYSAGH